MIYLQKATINTDCVFTLNEKTTLNPVFYIMSIFSNQNHDTKNILLSNDTSTNFNRWNQFSIEENAVEDLPNAVVSLIAGTYDYYVWQSTTDDLTLIDAVSVVESGKLTVEGVISAVPEFNDPATEYTFE